MASPTSPDPDEDDPVVASFNVFLNPTPPANKRLLVLNNDLRKEPNETDARDTTWGLTPTEFRVKPHAGVMEIDIPRDINANYDRAKGIQYGTALKVAKDDRADAYFGLGGGFGVTAPQPAPRKKDRETEAGLAGTLDWEDALRTGRVLREYTLRGEVPEEVSAYMIGVIQGDEVHLTPLSAYISLRPEPHHLHAMQRIEKQNALAFAKDANPNAAGPQPRTLQMTIKSSNDAGAETMMDRMRAVASEPWRRMRYVDENAQEAWDAYQETMVPLSEVKPATTSSNANKDKDPSNLDGDDDDIMEEGMESLELRETIAVTDVDKVPKLRTQLTAYHMDAKIAQRGDHYKSTGFYDEEVKRKQQNEGGQEADGLKKEPEPELEAAKRGRPKGRGGSAVAKKGGRGGRNQT